MRACRADLPAARLPYTIYVASDFAEGRAFIVVAGPGRGDPPPAFGGDGDGRGVERFDTVDAGAKTRAFAAIYASLIADGEPPAIRASAPWRRRPGSKPKDPAATSA